MTVHIAGAGLAGLAAALAASDRSHDDIVIHEAAPQPGGRCRTVEAGDGFSAIDNGAHVILGANRTTFAWLRAIGADDRIAPAVRHAIPFVDLPSSGTRAYPEQRSWRVPVAGHPLALPWHPRAFAPFMRAVFNAEPRSVAVSDRVGMAWRLLAAGHGALRPWIARESLTATFITPVLDALKARGVRLLFNDRLNRVTLAGGRATATGFSSSTVSLDDGDVLILALPPGEIARLLPGAVAGPMRPSPIVNVHFRLDAPAAFPDGAAMLGLTGGAADWLFARSNILTAMRSAAYDLVDTDGAEIAALFWRDAARALGLDAGKIPANRVIKERRATWHGTSLHRRALPHNVRVAGDWCVGTLPCCIEAALVSGRAAADYPCR